MNVYIWPFLVQKRLLKKISLLLMFIILASVTVIFRVTSNYKGGIISCALFLEDDDITAGKISSELMESDFIRFIKCSSKEDALSCVKNNRASCAWIFKSGMTETLKKSALNKKIQPIVEVYEKEDDALLSFCREILCAALYKAFSYEAYSSVKSSTDRKVFPDPAFPCQRSPLHT